MLPIGAKAPLFEAESTAGTVRLADAVGKRPVVLIFYPKDETPICTKQLCAVRDSKQQYAKYDALVVGVNPGTLEEHRRFAGKHLYDFPLVSDRDEAIRQQYGVGLQLLSFLGQQRIVFVIGKDGNIAYARKGNRPTAEILAALEAAETAWQANG
ncbi:peroxiredoxin [Gordoniibacillus kamchatkensis]|uniref:thioredoxin-dependent peroxiredoxin n=1 Tax=Gordoniibacillus kamchatkensis TaxID=1590651 RepID=A0ABR5AD24_9BACL|nr:peroxiredoxin [Paenibacillus sp. VKM B-2647]KIL38583.1 peroxiredoxin [Paenibacillus sp. VKM B-2647]